MQPTLTQKKVIPMSIAPTMPQIPRAFINHAKINQVFYHTTAQFTFEEQAVIYLYYLVGFSLQKISRLTGLSMAHIRSILILYSKRLEDKVDIFKKAVPYDKNDTVLIGEMLSYQNGQLLALA